VYAQAQQRLCYCFCAYCSRASSAQHPSKRTGPSLLLIGRRLVQALTTSNHRLLHHTEELLLHEKSGVGLVLMAGKAYTQKCSGISNIRYAQLKSLVMALCGCRS
jgi:hypothetical protein